MPDNDAPLNQPPVDPLIPGSSPGQALSPSKDAHVHARRGVVRTAWTMAGIAFAVYVLFILSGVLAQ